MAKVFAGLRVIEMGTFITGPAAAMYLGDLGADVIKVERPGIGDPFRSFKGGLYSPHYQTYNRNKRAITLDTRKTRIARSSTSSSRPPTSSSRIFARAWRRSSARAKRS